MKLFHSSKFSFLFFIFLATFIAGSGTRNAESNAAASDYVPCAPGSGGDLRTSSPGTLTVTVNTNETKQTIHNFGASDAWSTQFVGRWWPSAKRNAIADLLFETGLDADNDPKGIGLSGWRFNVGAGSNRQSYIWEPWNRADTFLSADYTSYDWSAHIGQRWFLQVAKAHGVEKFIAFVGSPPINMTKNGRAYCDPTVGTTNLADDKVDDFAVYLATIIKHFRDVKGIDFSHISPFNEPYWDWNSNSGECNRYNNSDIKRVVDALHSELGNQGLTTKILVPEAGCYAHLYEPPTERKGYIDAFFEPSSDYYIGNKIAHEVAGHGYFCGWPEWDDRLVGWRETLRNKLNAYSLEYWMTEYCILIPDEGWVPPEHRDYGLGRDLGIDPALWITRIIHHDMTVGSATGWQWWLAVSQCDYKDGLVYIDKSQTDGNYYESKMLWGMGNFSRFIRPGMQRVAVHRSDNATPRDTVKDLMVSAYYKSYDDDDIVVVVFVNWAYEDKPVQLNFLGAEISSLIPYVTKGYFYNQDNLTAYNLLAPDSTIAIPARSIVTIVGGVPGLGDCNKDGKVDFKDLAILASQWSQTNCGKCGGADLTGNKNVDIRDLAVLEEGWLAGATSLPEQARNPEPDDGKTVVSRTADLSWIPGLYTTSHDVYFGTSSPPPFVCNQTSTTFDTGTMDYYTAYYWRIDEANRWGKTTGVVWSFTTMTKPPDPP
ncbi:MAG TPA: glycoside hydrolase [Sedimentisphaerales bacterium]|nr:glycoside hydrolase [Sedimentisphaerales bacterium]